MAIFPQGLSHVDARCNAGERRVLHQLKRCLEDDYIIWHDVPIGPRARQPDFVILSPHWGVLLLEVKDWRYTTMGPATKDSIELRLPRGVVTAPHPLRQARDYVLELVDLMQRDPALVQSAGPFAGKLLFPYGWGVVMSTLRRAEIGATDFDAVFPTARTLLRDDLEPEVDPLAFQRRLWGLFTVHYPHTLTLPQRDRIRWHLFPEVRVNVQAPLDFEEPKAPDGPHAGPALPDLMQVMDLQQEQVARSMGEGHRVVHGVAGSGKTMILIFRAQHLVAAARPDRPIMVMCFNRTLATRIEALLRQRGVDERVQVRTFHSWCMDMVRSYQLGLPDGPRDDRWYRALAETLQWAVENGRVPGAQYTALLIDEAHDFEEAWLSMAVGMVTPETNSLLVLYDDAQSIYQARRRKFSLASVGIEARGRTSILRLNYRNTAEVLALASQCAHQLLQGDGQLRSEDELQLVQPATAGRRGPLPVLVQARDAQEEAQCVVDRLLQARREGLAWRDMAVLSRAKYGLAAIERELARARVPHQSMNSEAFRRFDWRADATRLLTLHSAKGLEFSWVCICGLQALPMGDESLEDATRLLYVGMTRATQQLVLSTRGDSVVVRQVRHALQRVQAEFAA